MANLAYGSSGQDVRELQKALIAAGYDVGSSGADGIIGEKTAAAIKAYQRDNGLSVDGIAGTQTQGSLRNGGFYNAQQDQETPVPAEQMGTQALPSFDSYLDSSGYEKYKKEITDAINEQTERAVNAYNKQIEETEENREKMARQAYIAKMQSQRNLDQQLSAAGYAGGMADSQRIRVENDYNNALADIDTQRQNEVDALERAIEDARLSGDSELAGYLAEYQQAASNNYQSYMQQIMAQQYAEAKAAAAAAPAKAASYSGGGGGNYSGGGYDNGGLTTSQIKQLQSVLGVTADGLYGSGSRATAGGLSAAEAYAKYVGGGGGNSGIMVNGKTLAEYSAAAGNYSAVKTMVNNAVNAGNKAEAKRILADAYSSGAINASDYSSLYNQLRG